MLSDYFPIPSERPTTENKRKKVSRASITETTENKRKNVSEASITELVKIWICCDYIFPLDILKH